MKTTTKRTISALFPGGLFARVKAETALAVGVAWGLFQSGEQASEPHQVEAERRSIAAKWRPGEARVFAS